MGNGFLFQFLKKGFFETKNKLTFLKQKDNFVLGIYFDYNFCMLKKRVCYFLEIYILMFALWGLAGSGATVASFCYEVLKMNFGSWLHLEFTLKKGAF